MLEDWGRGTGEERTEGKSKKRISIIAQLLPSNISVWAVGSSL